MRRAHPPPIDFRGAVDLDCGTVTASETSAGADISGRDEGGWIDALNPPARGVRVARLDQLGETDFERCAQIPESDWEWNASGLAKLPPSGGLCVRTSEGNLAIVKFERPLTGARLHIRYRLKYLG